MQPLPESLSRKMRKADVARVVVGALASVALIGVIGSELFAWLLPQELSGDSPWYIRSAVVTFFLRVFQLHIGIGTIALAAVLLVTRWRRSALIALLVAAILLTPFVRDFAPKHPPAPKGGALRLMSINLYFQNKDEAAIVKSIEDADPDVIVLVEVTPWSFENVIQKHLLDRYRYVVQPSVDGAGTVLSRVPYRVSMPAESGVGRPAVVFKIDEQDVALYAVHLVSPGHIWLVKQNRKQVLTFTEIAAAEKRPMILAGDCNFTQLTPNGQALHRAGLRSSHELIGFGLGNTWGPRWWPSLNWLPGIRIDHIWLSPQLTVTSHRVGLDTGSDHRPVIADIGLAKGD